LASVAAASGNHHSAPMGGRSALMGGTGVVLGVDGAAPFLNPATITRVRGGRLAFSARFYRYSLQQFSDFHQPGAADPALFGAADFSDESVTRHRVHSVPDSVCYFFPGLSGVARPQRLSICLAKTEEQELSLNALSLRDSSAGFRIDHNVALDADWSRFNLGPTWGVALTDELAVGASVFVTQTRYQHTIDASTVVEEIATGAASIASYQSHLSAYSWDITPRVGATLRLSERWSVGLGLTLPLVHLAGGIRQNYVNELGSGRTQWSGSGSFTAKPPLQIAGGVGAEWEAVRLEMDAFLALGKSQYAHGEIERHEVRVDGGDVTSRNVSTLVVNETTDTVLNLALGAEVFVAERLSVLAGAQTDVNGLPPLDPAAGEQRLFRTRLDYYRAGLGVCSYTDFGDLMLGLRFDYGSGRASAVNTLLNPPALGRSDVTELGVMLVLAGSINWGSIRQAAGAVGDAVSGRGGDVPDTPPQPLQAPRQP
jgi:hypothetical protein